MKIDIYTYIACVYIHIYPLLNRNLYILSYKEILIIVLFFLIMYKGGRGLSLVAKRKAKKKGNNKTR